MFTVLLHGPESKNQLLLHATTHESDTAEANERGDRWLRNWWNVAGRYGQRVVERIGVPRRTAVGRGLDAEVAESRAVLCSWGSISVFDVPANADFWKKPIGCRSSEVYAREIELVNVLGANCWAC